DLPLVDCFLGQLNQVFMNILANAIDMFDEVAHQLDLEYLKTNPQIITIQTQNNHENNSIEIRIKDNGKGMTPEVKEKAFEYLFTTKVVGKGTGLGLAIAHQIITEKHGGSLSIKSELGKGTEFIICLPI
ncbi:MAG: ATP-binding protein, partial [Cyanobacteria bacterium J06632_19]